MRGEARGGRGSTGAWLGSRELLQRRGVRGSAGARLSSRVLWLQPRGGEQQRLGNKGTPKAPTAAKSRKESGARETRTAAAAPEVSLVMARGVMRKRDAGAGGVRGEV